MKQPKLDLLKIDNIVFLKSCMDKVFDLAPVDPPYFSGPERRKYYGNSTGKSKHSKTGSHQLIKRIEYPITKKWEVPNDEYRNQLFRVSKNQIIWGANYFDFIGMPFKTPRGKEIYDFIKENPRGWIIWDKCNGSSSFNDYELAWTSFDMPTIIFRYMWNGMMQGKSMHEGWIQKGDKSKNEKRIHPTQKPVILYKWILSKFAKSGDKIFDSHLGSGSIAIACHDMGFDLTACEIDERYFNDAKNRIDLHKSQLQIFSY